MSTHRDVVGKSLQNHFEQEGRGPANQIHVVFFHAARISNDFAEQGADVGPSTGAGRKPRALLSLRLRQAAPKRGFGDSDRLRSAAGVAVHGLVRGKNQIFPNPGSERE